MSRPTCARKRSTSKSTATSRASAASGPCLKSGEQATDDLARVSSAIGANHPAVAGWGVRVQPLSEWLVGPRVREAGSLLLAAVGFLLLMACANVANLLLARATTRQTDLSIRAALGAGRSRLTRQMLVEGGVLAGAGAVLGVLGAYWVVTALRNAAPEFIPRVNVHSVRVSAMC